MNRRTLLTALLIAAVLSVAMACDRESTAEFDDDQIDVVVTTTMLEDLVEQLGGEHFQAHGLVNVGADPHVYQPQPGDARMIAESDAVVMNGLLLEGWMESLIRNAGGERPVVVAGDAIDDDQLIRVEGAVDPHVWFDVGMWRQVADHVAGEMAEMTDDEQVVEAVQTRHAHYDEMLAQLDDWVGERMETVAEQQRVLITSHDAFNYFGRAYGIDVEAVQGLSTEQEPSQRDVANIIELVDGRNAPAVFTETSVNPALIEQVARETGAQRVGPLYSDSVGPADSGADTYVGMVQSNVEMITEGLGGDYEVFDDAISAVGVQGDGA